MKRIALIASIVLASIATRASAGDKLPSEADVRKSIERGLPSVEKSGLAWIKKRDCMSCHTVTFMLWAHTEAAEHGIAIDRKKLAEWTEWSVSKSLATRVFFKLDSKIVQSVPEAMQPKLEKMIEEGFTHEKDFVAALAKALSPEELKQHQTVLVKQARASKKVEGNDGGGLDTMSQLFLAREPGSKELKPGFNASTMELIVRMQEGNGSWRAGGQLPSRRWNRPTADQTTTMWTILALASYDVPTPAIQKSIEKAHASVKKPAGDGNLEWIVARLLYDQKFAPEAFEATKQQLLKRQNSDGGWSVLANAESDAFSTGMGLYALRVAGLSHKDDVIRRGQKYLVDKQNPDGSWTVSPALTSVGGPDRVKKLEPIWRHWGTAWATIGLAKSLPTK